jgi:membrane-associated phospholipid phosphatase
VQQALALLPPPPAPGSDAQAANMQTLNTILATATPQMKANAQATANYTVFDFATVLGPGFTASNLPTLNTFINNVTINTVNSASQLKAVYNSPGPQMPATYPSTQTMMGMNEGALLALMIPEKGPQLQTFGVQEGLNRLIMNAHWPTDVAGGQMLSTIYLQDLFASPRFVSDFNAAKVEVRDQQGLK